MSYTKIQALRVEWEAALDRFSQDEQALRDALSACNASLRGTDTMLAEHDRAHLDYCRRVYDDSARYVRACAASVRAIEGAALSTPYETPAEHNRYKGSY